MDEEGAREPAGDVVSSPLYVAAPAANPRLRVGLLFKAGGLPAGVAVLLQALAACEAATIVCLAAYTASVSASQKRNRALVLHERLDRRLATRHRPRSNASTHPKSHFPDARQLSCQAVPGNGAGWALAPEAVGELGDLNLDVLLALDRSDWSGEVLRLARHGVWQYRWNGHGAEHLDNALFAGLESGQPVILCQLDRQEEGRIQAIARMDIAGYPRSLSISRDKAYDGVAFLAPRALRRLRQGMPFAVNEAAMAGKPLRTPTISAAAALIARQALRWFCFRWQYRRGEWWFLAMRRRESTADSRRDGGPDGVTHSMTGFRPLPAAAGRYYADPFLIEANGKTHLFFEDFDQQRGRGHISHAVLADDGTPGPASMALERPYHLSYPFIFRWQDQIWLMPETGENRAVELYRCEEFPRRWSFHRDLLQGWRAVDATLHADENGRWWMFVMISEDAQGAGALFLFMADSPLGPWRPHPGNPVQSDIRYTRPGGRLFRHEGKLLRPAQDCSLRYGGALWLMEVTAMTPQAYGEMPIRRLDPLDLPGNLCLHHRDATQRFEFVDGMRLRPPERAV
jgi:hypothetical protein